MNAPVQGKLQLEPMVVTPSAHDLLELIDALTERVAILEVADNARGGPRQWRYKRK